MKTISEVINSHPQKTLIKGVVNGIWWHNTRHTGGEIID